MLKAFGILFVVMAVNAAIAAIDQKPQEYVICKSQDDVRSISVTVAKNKSCAAHYSKRGVDEVIAKSSKPDDCHRHVERLRDVLKAAQYSCRDVAKAQITTSSEAAEQ